MVQNPLACIRESRSQCGLLIIPKGIIAIKVDGTSHEDMKINCRNGLNKG